MTVRILTGDCRDVLATMAEGSVQCCVTSPPYFGLRDYGNAAQIGLEPTPDAYVAEMVAVFREVRRVLRDDGTLWLNLGDSYASGTKGSGGGASSSTLQNDGRREAVRLAGAERSNGRARFDTRSFDLPASGLKPKDLIGIPWLVAFALRADGWYLRSEIIWHKKNPMPESVEDRPTKAHEQVFLLSKNARYFYDAKAIAEDAVGAVGGAPVKIHDERSQGRHGSTSTLNTGWTVPADTRNRRSVWPIATQPFSGAHFATMPPELAETCIKAGSSERGQCPHCGAPWARQVEVERQSTRPGRAIKADASRNDGGRADRVVAAFTTTGWAPTCACPAHAPAPQMILDPFGGAGTTALVADRLQRDAAIIELNPEYAALARERITQEAGMFGSVAAE